MITTSIVQRTFYIKRGESKGTAFAIEYEGSQYLVTAAHCLKGFRSPGTIEIFHEDQWKNLQVNPIRSKNKDLDLIVLSPSFDLAPRHPITLSMAHAYHGEDVYIVGFPIGFYQDAGSINNGFPLPIVAKGCIGGFEITGLKRMIISVIASEGYSGGPIVLARNLNPPQVIGFVSESFHKKLAIAGSDNLHVPEASGILVGIDAEDARNILKDAFSGN